MAQTDIHIVVTFDDRYWAPAFALMRSVCLFTFRRKDLVFHLFHRTISDPHRQALDRIATEFGARLVYYDIDRNAAFTSIAARARYNKRLSNIVYARILFAQLLPADVSRLLYLDCDMLVRVPIERLTEMDMAGYPLAAVPDYIGAQIMTRKSLKDPRGIFDAAMRYFNAGLLLIDMDKLRGLDILGQFEAAIDSGLLDKIYYDQDFLNIAFRDNWLELDRFWNLLDPRQSHEVLNPSILHYTGNRKPWLYKPKVAFARLYRHVMTNEVYYAYMLERAPAWQRPFIRLVERANLRTGAQ
ncbi:MAG: glycosyltransferase family 8 protein [Devosia sp.]